MLHTTCSVHIQVHVDEYWTLPSYAYASFCFMSGDEHIGLIKDPGMHHFVDRAKRGASCNVLHVMHVMCMVCIM